MQIYGHSKDKTPEAVGSMLRQLEADLKEGKIESFVILAASSKPFTTASKSEADLEAERERASERDRLKAEQEREAKRRKEAQNKAKNLAEEIARIRANKAKH